jgi:hypothetical protein
MLAGVLDELLDGVRVNGVGRDLDLANVPVELLSDGLRDGVDALL